MVALFLKNYARNLLTRLLSFTFTLLNTIYAGRGLTFLDIANWNGLLGDLLISFDQCFSDAQAKPYIA